MSTIVITNNQNLLSGIAQTITADDPYQDLSIADRLKNSLKAFSDIQVSLASDYQSGGFLNFGFVDGQTYRVTLDNYDVWYTGTFSQFGSQISQIYVGSTNGVDYVLLEGLITYSGMPFFTSMVNGSKLNVIEAGAGSFGSQSSISTAVVMVNLDGGYSNGTLSGSINKISSGLFTKNSTSYAYFDKLSGGDVKFTVSNIGTVSAQASVTGTKFTDLSASIVDYQTYSVIDTVAISNAVIDITKKSSAAWNSDSSDSYTLQGSLPSSVETGGGNDTITGSGFNDSVFGGDGKDNLIGGAGNDYLDGGAGEDILNGGSGDDLYVVDSAGDVIKGEETYQASTNFNPFSSENYSTNVLQVKGTTSFILANDQRIGFLTAGKYIANSTGGYDYLFTNTDSVNIKGNIFDERIDGNAAGNKLEGSGGNDGIDGKAGNDTLDGGDGNDWLDGGLGNDSLLGGAGDDTLWVDYGDFNTATSSYGPAGKDTLIGGAGNDIAYFALSESDYFVSKTDTTITLTRKLDSSSVITIDRTQANGVELISFQGGPTINVIDLIAGAATAGNDNLFQRTSLATTTLLVIDGLAGNDTITGTNISTYFDTLYGPRPLGDVLNGGDGNDSVLGLDGYDYLDGGAGNDTLNGGAGDDLYIVDSVNDVILGEENPETNPTSGDALQVKGAISYVLNSQQNIFFLTAGEFDSAAYLRGDIDWYNVNNTNHANIKANDFSQRMLGNAGENKLEAMGGNDYVWGKLGNDTLDGGDGNDTLDGGAGNDSLFGGAGDDELRSDFGEFNLLNSVMGSGGKDTIVGGAGNDTVYMQFDELSYAVSRTDTTIILTNKTDVNSVITIDRTLANGVELISFSGAATISLNNLLAGVATSGNDTLFQRQSLVGDGGLTIDGLAGNDTIIGTTIADSLLGGEGKDSLVGSGDNDYLDGGEGEDTADYSALDNSILVKLNGSEFGVVEKGGLSPVLNLSFEDVNLSNSFGSNITIVGNPFISTIQKNSGNSSIYFDGRASGISINNSDLNFGVSDYVIDFYFKTDGSQNPYSVILSSMHDGGWGELNNGTSDGGILNYYNGVLLDGVNLNDGAWHHFEGGQIDGLAFLKIDDNLLDSESVNSISYNFNNLLIGKLGGRWIGNSDNSFRGWIDDFKISKYMPISEDRISNIENVIGSRSNDDIEGDHKRNILSGRDGADFINGGENNDVLQGEVGNDSLDGGEGRDYLNGGEGDDYLDGGVGIDLLIGGSGDDIYVVDTLRDVLIDQSGWDTIKSENLNEINLQRYRGIEAAEYTGTGAVTLIGSQSNNSLIGGTGADTLSGKFGNDILTGGDNADSFVFNAKLDAQFNFDQITDFTIGVDKLVLDKSIFTLFSNAIQDSNLVMGMDAQDSDDYLIYDSNTQTLYYDADGNAAVAKVAFVQFVGINSLNSGDFLVI